MVSNARAVAIGVCVALPLFAGACSSPGANSSGTSSSSALTPVASLSATTASSGGAYGWFATSAPTTGPSATPQGRLPGGVDAAAFARDAGGAVMFVRTYLAAVDKALTAADPSWLTGWSSSSCRACTEQVEKVKIQQARGWHVRPAHVTRADLAGIVELRDQYVVQGAVASDRYSLIDGPGTSVSTQPARTQNVQFVVSWVGGRWVIGAQNQVPNPSR